MRFTTKYNDGNCVAECQFNHAFNQCKCIPWHYPRVGNEPICEFHGMQCFEEEVRKREQCNQEDTCMEPCQMTTYAYTLLYEPISEKEECKLVISSANGTLNYPIDHPLLYIEDLDKHYLWVAGSRASYFTKQLKCHLTMRSTSILHIKPATSRVNVITQRVRVTFADQIAGFGKIVFEIL